MNVNKMSMETAIIVLSSLLIAVILLFSVWAYYKLMPTMVKKLRGAQLWKGRDQKRIETQFHKEYKRNIAPMINENPLIAEHFPETLELIEELGQETFGNALIWTNLIKPLLKGVSMLSPSNPTEQKIQQAASFASSNPIVDLGVSLIQNVLTTKQSPLKLPEGNTANKVKRTVSNHNVENI